MELVTSLQNSRVKLAYGLQNRARTRRKERKIVLEGVRLIRDAVEQGQKPDFILYEPQSANYDLIALLQDKPFDLIPVTEDVMQYVSDTQQPQGIVGIFPLPTPKLPRKPARVLILDAIREPGNMGTILRTAAAAGIDIVICAPDCVDPYNPKVLRAGMGAHFRLPIAESAWNEIAEYCAHTSIFLATGGGATTYSDVDWAQSWTLIIGNEAHGGGEQSGKIAHTTITIPISGDTESLNAAVATGIILFEAQRQGRFKS